MTEPLKPCPFCGCTDIDPTGWTGMDLHRNRTFGPSCTKCGVTAESSDDWQRRVYTADWSSLERRMLALLDERLPPVRCVVCGEFSPTPGCTCDSPTTGRLKADPPTSGERLLKAAREAEQMAVQSGKEAAIFYQKAMTDAISVVVAKRNACEPGERFQLYNELIADLENMRREWFRSGGSPR